MPRHIIHQPRYLGENLKRLRRSHDWTIDRLAGASGLSKGYVSMIETGKRSPHWSVLMRMIHPLGSTLCRFFTEAESVVPAEDGILNGREQTIVLEGEAPNERGQFAASSESNHTRILTPWHERLASEVVDIFLLPHSEWTPDPISIPGNVVCWGIEGRLLLVIGGTEYIMREGDCLEYDGSSPHSIRNYTDNPSRGLMVVSPVAL